MDKTEYVQYKIKYTADKMVPWEQIPNTGCEAIATIEAMVTLNNPDVWEIRWNRIGSFQGHYIPMAKFHFEYQVTQ